MKIDAPVPNGGITTINSAPDPVKPEPRIPGIDSTSIEVGKRAQFNIYETNDFRNIFYQQGQLRPSYSTLGQAFIHHE